MSASLPQRGPTLAGIGLGLLLALVSIERARASASDGTTKLDCGVNALFLLLRLEGRPVTLDRMELALPPQHKEGYSMSELAAAARSLGLDLDGVRFAKGDRALERPAIAFLQDAKGGHFAVLRPVGTTGTMVQVLDPPHSPWITDYDRLFAAKPWTGRVLLPRGPRLVRYAWPLLAAAACTILAAVAIRSRQRASKRQQVNVPVTA